MALANITNNILTDTGVNVSSLTPTSTTISTTAPLQGGGDLSANRTLSITQSGTSSNGFLSSTDWNTFNNKQAAGNYMTSLTGEATGTGPGATAVTLNNASVTAKVLTGVNITGGTVVATDSILTAFGKLQNQINGLIGSSIYQGVWNAATNNPALASGVGTRGYYYIVNVAGNTNLDGITDWFVGDWAIFDGTAWQQVDNTDAVVSVNGQTGAVSLTTDNIPEGATNQYFLNSRARAALSFAAGSGAYNSTTGVITIPTNNNQITNGANYITLASLSGAAPIIYNNGTGAISITQAGTASNGYLSSTDWNTFNNKQSALTNPVTGTGTLNTIALFTSNGSTIGNSSITQSSTAITIASTSTEPFKIYGDSSATNGLFRVQIGDVTDTFGTGTRTFLGDGGIDVFIGTANGSYTPGNTYIALNHSGEISMGAGASVSKQFILATTGILTLSNLAGTGSRIVVADSSGNLSASSALSGYITGTGTTNYLPKFTGTSTIGNSGVSDDGTTVGIGLATTFSSTVTLTTSDARLLGGNTAGRLIVSNSDTSSYLSINGSSNGNNIALITNSFITFNSGASYAEQMRLNASGNLSLGNTNDTYKLDVTGASRILASTYTAGSILYLRDAAATGSNTTFAGLFLGSSPGTDFVLGKQSTNTVGSFAIKTGGGTTLMTLNDSGAATFSSSIDATVLNSTRTSGYLLRENSGSGYGIYKNSTTEIGIAVNGNVALNFASSGAATFSSSVTAKGDLFIWGGNAAQAGQITANSAGGGLYIASSGTNQNIRLVPSGTGIVQVISALDVSSSVTATELYLSTSNGVVGNINSSNANGGYITWQTSGTTIADIGTAQQIFGSGGNDTFGINGRGARAIAFGTNNTERMRITSGGNVGIGTTSPSYPLDVAGTSRSDLHIFRSNQSAPTADAFIFRPADNTIALGTANTERMRITSGGDVCINATSTIASAKLYVNGIGAFGNIYVGALGTGTVYSNAGTLTNTNPSDRRLKTNIIPLTYGLSDILKLNPVSYNWKDGTNGKQFGFIAQEVQEIMPDAVKQGEYLGLEKDAIYSALVNAIKELKQELDTLKNK